MKRDRERRRVWERNSQTRFMRMTEREEIVHERERERDEE